jgi:hypothetical protein
MVTGTTRHCLPEVGNQPDALPFRLEKVFDVEAVGAGAANQHKGRGLPTQTEISMSSFVLSSRGGGVVARQRGGCSAANKAMPLKA